VTEHETAQQAKAVDCALTKISRVALLGVPAKCGYIFYANEVRTILKELVEKVKTK
jgi:hypothetical protein